MSSSPLSVLLDTHVILWLAHEPEKCGPALDVLTSPETDLWISAASTWELAIKTSLGRVRLPLTPGEWIEDRRRLMRALLMPVEHRHAGAVVGLPWHHRDPFDRLLLAQAATSDLVFATADRTLEAYGVPLLLIGR